MKKSILGIMAASLLLVSCAENDYQGILEKKRAVTFVPAVESSNWNANGSTRGILYTETSFSGSDVFGVSAYRYNGTDVTAATATANFLYRAKVQRVLEKWRTNETYYWPFDEDKLDFYAYYPYNHTNVTVREQSTPGPMQIFYTVNTDPTQQVDFMTAIAKERTFNTESDVPLNFRHELTAVKLLLADNVAPGWIKSITFNHIATQGTLTVGGEWGALNDGSFSLNMETYYGSNGFKTTDSNNLINTGSELTANTTTLLMIPQEFTADNQKLTVVFANEAHPDGVELSTQLTGYWEAGKTITYHISTSDINVLQVAAVNYPSSSTWGNAWVKSSYSSGDEVGLYAIDNTGAVQVDNTKLTYDGTNWNTATGTSQLFTPGLTWFMYFPYKAEGLAHNGVKDESVVTTAVDFFADGIAAWTPNDNQSTVDDLKAQDLQVATGTLTQASTLQFDMAHTMGLVHLSIPASKEVPNLVYFDGNEGVNSTTRVSTSSETTTVAPSRAFITKVPYEKEATFYLYIAKPGEVTLSATTTSQYNAWDLSNNTASVTMTVAENNYVTHEVTNKFLTRNYMKRGWVYEYSGVGKEWQSPVAGIYTFECWGAQGDDIKGSMTEDSGRGGYTKGNLSIAQSDKFYIYVGQKGQGYSGGWNGGGNGRSHQQDGGGGGGATDIRLTFNSNPLNIPSLKSRIMVAGAGAGSAGGVPGAGGGLEGLDGHDDSEGTGYKYDDGYSATGGKQNAPGYPGNANGDMGDQLEKNSESWNTVRNANKGDFGKGGDANYEYCGGGGGGAGYWGGGASLRGHGGPGGGSSFIAGYSGCLAVTSMTGNTISIGSNANHPSGKNFITNTTLMVAGNVEQSQPDGSSTNGHYGNGYARITENFIE